MRQSQFPKSNSPKPEVAAPALQKVWPKPMDFWWFFSKCQLHLRGGAGHPPVHPSNTGSTPGRNGWKTVRHEKCVIVSGLKSGDPWNLFSIQKLLGFWGTFFHSFSIGSLLGKRAGSSRILGFLGTWDMFFWPSDDMCSTPVAGNGCVPSQLPQSCNGRCGKWWPLRSGVFY
jgi:hypothetical protein